MEFFGKEADTYRIGVTRNSCSTMHKISAKVFEEEDFSIEHLTDFAQIIMKDIIHQLNIERENFIKTKDKKYWWNLIQLLPSSYNQRATLFLNYEVLYNMYHSRKNHKLDEWHTFCQWIETLPYAKELIIGDKGDDVDG